MNNTYSQCDAKGRCIHHPTFQLKTKKLGGGWKTLTTICSLCAYESFCKSSSSSSSSRSSSRPARARCDDEIARNDERSVGGSSIDQSILSAPAAYHRRTTPQHMSTSHAHHGGGPSTPSLRRQQSEGHDRHHYRHRQAEPSMSGPRPRSHHTNGLEEQFSKLSHHHHTEQDSIDGSCDLTAEISYRSSGSRNSHASSISSSSHSNSSTQRVRNLVESPNNNQEEYVCGMEFDDGRLYYTGQIDNRSRLPHGLGTLRDNNNRILLEGEWHNGTLVAPAASSTTTLQQHKASYPSYQVPPTSVKQENEYDSHPETEDEVDDDDDDNDDNSSISSDALSVSYSSSSRFAETKKSPLPPPTIDSRVRRVRWTEPQTKHYQTEAHYS